MAHIPQIPPRERGEARGDGPRGPSGEDSGRRIPPYPGAEPAREPAFMLPGPVVMMCVLMIAVHIVRATLTYYQDLQVLAWFAFIPARYADTFVQLPGGLPADVWTFVTYSLLHGSWLHLATNAIWLVAFGSAVARRFGAARFWLFSAAAAAGGALLHLGVHYGDPVPVVGASAAIAGQMAAAARFVFDAGGPLIMRRPGDEAAFRRPARSLAETFRNRTAVAFIALWFFINLAVGLGSSAAGGVSIAWEAHLGGFLVGLLAFRFFDPVRRR